MVLNLVTALIYFFAAKFGLSLAFLQSNASPVWPPTGIALACLLIFGYRLWPGIMVGAFFANFLTQGSIWTSAAIAIGNTAEAVVGAYFVTRYAQGRNAFLTAKTIVAFVIWAGMLSTAISATVGVTSLSLGGYSDWSNFGVVWITWWMGDFTSNLIVAPLLIVWTSQKWSVERRRLPEVAGLAGVTALICGVVFLNGIKEINYPLQFLILPLLIWTGFRFNQRGTTLLTLFASIIAIFGTIRGWGPLSSFSPNESLILLQAFMATIALTGLFFSAILYQQKKMEWDLRVSRENLVETNRELEQFAYASSHDLKEPLRKITTYIDLIRERTKERLDPPTEQHMQTVVSAVQRMSQLIDDLLSYSQIARERQRQESVDLNVILQHVLKDLDSTIQQAQAVVTFEPLPTIFSRSLHMQRLLQNLIGNAIKFHGAEPPKIHVTASRKDDAWLFAIRDNGIGIEAEYQEKIFDVFQRLHSTHLYPGTGIGLAICKRIVEAHGGSIWVESKPGLGSTFYFTIL